MVWYTHEPGTSRHCGACGTFKTNLTLRDRTYACDWCGVVVDRDVNAARNNWLAAATALLSHAPAYRNAATDDHGSATDHGGTTTTSA